MDFTRSKVTCTIHTDRGIHEGNDLVRKPASMQRRKVPFIERNTTVLADMARANPKSQSCEYGRKTSIRIQSIIM